MVKRFVLPHLLAMAFRHPHTDAEYFIVAQADESYGIRIVIPDQEPTLVTGFARLADAEAWVDAHRERVRSPAPKRAPFKLARSR